MDTSRFAEYGASVVVYEDRDSFYVKVTHPKINLPIERTILTRGMPESVAREYVECCMSGCLASVIAHVYPLGIQLV